MPRPRKCRRIQGQPPADYFKPRGVPMRDLTEVYLALEGVEALRLADLEGLNMEQAASRMGVSRHTFGRVLAEARRAVAAALVGGQALRIQGGSHALDHGGSRTGFPGKSYGRQGVNAKESKMSKVAVSSEGPNLQDKLDPRFGRAAGYLVVDTETMETTWLDNGSSQALAHGAGIQAAQNVANSGAAAVLTGLVGPKAFMALRGAGVKIGVNLSGLTVAEAVERYKNGDVEFAESPSH